MTARVSIHTLGCKLNQAETDSLKRQFAHCGCEIVDNPDDADIYILNTCTVTHIADRKSRHLLRLAQRRNPNAFIIATGCYAQRAPDELTRIGGIDMVAGNEEKPHLLEIMKGMGLVKRREGDGGHPVLRTRALVKVQDGCNTLCSYCIVPKVRGRGRSVPISKVVDEIRARVKEGYREIVLTGTQIGNYGLDTGETLRELLEHILLETGVERLRLTSINPQDVTPALLDLWGDGRLCRHFHLPLQSGSDSVLSRMRRRYSTSEYETTVRLIRDKVPDVSITTDIIIGFPGESDDEFEQSYLFCERMGFSAIHVFPFSPRPTTSAALMPKRVDGRVKRERSVRMLELGRRSVRQFREGFSGRTMPVLWEREVDEIWVGLTDNYIRVFARSNEGLNNRLVEAKLIAGHNEAMWALF